VANESGGFWDVHDNRAAVVFNSVVLWRETMACARVRRQETVTHVRKNSGAKEWGHARRNFWRRATGTSFMATGRAINLWGRWFSTRLSWTNKRLMSASQLKWIESNRFETHKPKWVYPLELPARFSKTGTSSQLDDICEYSELSL
jgi:hypothetical protein